MGGFVAFAVALVLALVATPLAARVARKLGVVDHPGELKVHTRPVPYLGGVAVFVAVLPAVVLGDAVWLVPLAGALVLGVVDDARHVAARTRLACEAGIGVAAGLALAPGSALGVLATTIVVVVLVNAVNLLDGLDGLASGVGVFSSFGLAFFVGSDRIDIALALTGALAGFLVFNRPPARIYLGDGGAYLLGASLALLVASAFQESDAASYWLIVPLVVAVPLSDTAVAIVRRLRSRRPLFVGDRSHVYAQLVDRGRTPGAAVRLCIALQAALVAAALVAAALVALALPDPLAIVFAVALLAAIPLSAVLGGFLTPRSNL